eukprot:TRINITY_DN31997_c0_g1_i1.p1 TRINITY_DN31997_c0_g1~~TRINITY_DN31997_c0_g1_i1.p1  ORF type:complete len:110 (+),score=9.02 TRINITY_DN31997_c0_g1_i1:19-348(+)
MPSLEGSKFSTEHTLKMDRWGHIPVICSSRRMILARSCIGGSSAFLGTALLTPLGNLACHVWDDHVHCTLAASASRALSPSQSYPSSREPHVDGCGPVSSVLEGLSAVM